MQQNTMVPRVPFLENDTWGLYTKMQWSMKHVEKRDYKFGYKNHGASGVLGNDE